MPTNFKRATMMLLALGMTLPVFSQGLEYVKSNYTKHESYIAMRDGVRLFTAVYIPKDHSQTYPILLTRTPYSIGPYGSDQYRDDLGPSAALAREKYIIVYQDVRGRFMSEGQFEHMRPHRAAKNGPKEIDESTDTYDTIDWLLKNVPDTTAASGMWGISYPRLLRRGGHDRRAPGAESGLAQAPVIGLVHRRRLASQRRSTSWPTPSAAFSGSGWPSPGRPRWRPSRPIERDIETAMTSIAGSVRCAVSTTSTSRVKSALERDDEAPNLDECWKARNLRPHLKNIKPAVMTVGGWFDAENLFGASKFIAPSRPRAPVRTTCW